MDLDVLLYGDLICDEAGLSYRGRIC